MSLNLRFYAALLGLAVAGLGAGTRDARLVTAAEQRDTKAVMALLKQGVDANTALPDGATALHWAAHWNEVALAKALTMAGADVNAANDYGVTPLFLAATNGSAEMVDVLLGAGGQARAALPYAQI